MCVYVKGTGRLLSFLSHIFCCISPAVSFNISVPFNIFIPSIGTVFSSLPISPPYSHLLLLSFSQFLCSPFHYFLFQLKITFSSFLSAVFIFVPLPVSPSLRKARPPCFSSFILIPPARPCPHPLSCWSSDGIDRRVAVAINSCAE